MGVSKKNKKGLESSNPFNQLFCRHRSLSLISCSSAALISVLNFQNKCKEDLGIRRLRKLFFRNKFITKTMFRNNKKHRKMIRNRGSTIKKK
jgi:hypothetical protein